MLAESKKQDLQEITDLLKGMDSISMMIMKANAAVLLAKQELTESKSNQQKEVRQLSIMEYAGEKIMWGGEKDGIQSSRGPAKSCDEGGEW